MVDVSRCEERRKLVESSLIANFDNINIRPSDIPVCRITAPAVLRSLNIDYKPTGSLVLPAPTAGPTTDQGATQVVTPPRPGATADIAPVTSEHDLPTQHLAVAISPDPGSVATERQITQPSHHDIPSSTSLHMSSRPLPSIQLTSPSVPVFLATRRRVMQRQLTKSRSLATPYQVNRKQVSDSPRLTNSQPLYPISQLSTSPINFPSSSAPLLCTSKHIPPKSPLLSQPASAVPRRLLVVPTPLIQTSPTQTPYSPIRFNSQPLPLIASPSRSPSDFPPSSAPPGRSVATSGVRRLATDWLPAEYLQSPSIPLTANTRLKRAHRHSTRDRQRGTPYKMTHHATGSPLSSSQRSSQRPSLLWQRLGRPPKQFGKLPK